MIPREIREILEPFLPEGVPWDDVGQPDIR